MSASVYTYKKIVLTVFLAAFFVCSTAASAQSPDTNTICSPPPPDGSIRLQVKLPLGNKIHECTEQVIVFEGGQFINEARKAYYVSSLQDYISGVYNFGIGLIALSAVIVMMIGGFQYVLAGGNQTRIGTAKSLISGALGGLALSLLSYTLLNTINPRITSLEVKDPSPVTGIDRFVFCQDIGDQVIGQSDPTKKFTPVSGQGTPTFKVDTWCGQSYYVPGTNEQTTCLGLDCNLTDGATGGTDACVQGVCKSAIFYGQYAFTNDRYIDNNLDIIAICESPSPLVGKYAVTSLVFDLPNYEDTNMPYAVSGNLSTNAGCEAGTAKYLLRAEVNDSAGLITIDDNYYIGKKSCGASKPLTLCMVNGQQQCPNASGDCPPGTYIYDPGAMSAEVLYTCNSDLWTQAEVDTGGQLCNITIEDANFPADHTPPTGGTGGSTGGTGLTYSSINSGQINDASPALRALLNDLAVTVSAAVTSISDDDLFTGNCTPWDPSEVYGDDNNCVHSRNSAHYGGTLQTVASDPSPRLHTTGFSCAADLWSSTYASLDAVLQNWKSNGNHPIALIQCEATGSGTPVPCSAGNIGHLHVSVTGCGSQ